MVLLLVALGGAAWANVVVDDFVPVSGGRKT
jgi:hypothetical protein